MLMCMIQVRRGGSRGLRGKQRAREEQVLGPGLGQETNITNTTDD